MRAIARREEQKAVRNHHIHIYTHQYTCTHVNNIYIYTHIAHTQAQGELSPEEKSKKQLESIQTMIKGTLAPALVGTNCSNSMEIDDKLSEMSGVPKTFVSLTMADAAASMLQVCMCICMFMLQVCMYVYLYVYV